jgi:hypothetical protein
LVAWWPMDPFPPLGTNMWFHSPSSNKLGHVSLVMSTFVLLLLNKMEEIVIFLVWNMLQRDLYYCLLRSFWKPDYFQVLS